MANFNEECNCIICYIYRCGVLPTDRFAMHRCQISVVYCKQTWHATDSQSDTLPTASPTWWFLQWTIINMRPALWCSYAAAKSDATMRAQECDGDLHWFVSAKSLRVAHLVAFQTLRNARFKLFNHFCAVSMTTIVTIQKISVREKNPTREKSHHLFILSTCK